MIDEDKDKNKSLNLRRLLLIFFVVCVIFGAVSDNSQTENKSAPDKALGDLAAKKSLTVAPQKIHYDTLQRIFIALNESTTTSQLEEIIQRNNLSYTRQTYSSSSAGLVVTYRVAYEDGVAMQKHSLSGDYLDVTFRESDGKIWEWCYFNWDHSADAYYFVSTFTHQKQKFIGYVYHDYDAPNYSNYVQEISAESVLQKVMRHQR